MSCLITPLSPGSKLFDNQADGGGGGWGKKLPDMNTMNVGECLGPDVLPSWLVVGRCVGLGRGCSVPGGNTWDLGQSNLGSLWSYCFLGTYPVPGALRGFSNLSFTEIISQTKDRR